MLEGKIAVTAIMSRLEEVNKRHEYPILSELYNVFNGHYDLSSFVSNIIHLSENNFSDNEYGIF